MRIPQDTTLLKLEIPPCVAQLITLLVEGARPHRAAEAATTIGVALLHRQLEQVLV